MSVQIRHATPDDLLMVTKLFRETIQHVSSNHYSPVQVAFWKSSTDDLPKWRKRIEDLYFIVAEKGSMIVGFAYLKDGNYFDGLFVHHEHQGDGIATLLADTIEEKVIDNGHKTVHSDVSITAKPFFEKRGYTVDEFQMKPFKGVTFESYIVSKTLV
ncbi:MAG: GNAT family N-acetyltransferase [Flavobacteriaceae bacterium]|nr:GNAT family N-acetyltransferase [Flavobacteriaceae bacterium]